jgi:hypothetical protein
MDVLHLEFLGKAIEDLDEWIDKAMELCQSERELEPSIIGIEKSTPGFIIAEVGVDMSYFPQSTYFIVGFSLSEK